MKIRFTPFKRKRTIHWGFTLNLSKVHTRDEFKPRIRWICSGVLQLYGCFKILGTFPYIGPLFPEVDAGFVGVEQRLSHFWSLKLCQQLFFHIESFRTYQIPVRCLRLVAHFTFAVLCIVNVKPGVLVVKMSYSGLLNRFGVEVFVRLGLFKCFSLFRLFYS